MQGEDANVAVFGTTEKPDAAKTVKSGDLSVLLDGDSIRAIRWKGVEVVRGIAWPVRDPSWITIAPKTHAEKLEEDGRVTRYEQRFSIADDALSCRLFATFDPEGVVTAEIEMTASRDFKTNRAGFTLLHPIDGVAGQPLRIRHSDGSEEQSQFPRLIAPAQPAMDIVGISHEVDGISVDIAFTGEIFEMEDQRNWTDASYKTYCRPLVFPFTYTIAKGETVRQKIQITVSGGDERAAGSKGEQMRLAAAGQFPQIALALEKGWQPTRESTGLVAATGVKILQIRTGPEFDTETLDAAKKVGDALKAEFDVEIVLPQGDDFEAALKRAAAAIGAAGIEPARIVALPEPYLKSYQPSGPWPDGPTPADCVAAAKAVFSKARIGGGVLTNFTEFNRCRPDPTRCDFVTHSTTALVHAADDRSVTESIEALAHVFESAAQLGGGKPLRLGLASIGMRSNPYGAGVADNEEQTRRTMAMYDPRQRGLFGAAFAVSVLAATQDCAVAAIALGAPAGPFAIIAERQPVHRPYYDGNARARVYPIYHVVRAAAAMSGRSRLKVSNLAPGIAAVAAKGDKGTDLIFANLGEQPVEIEIPEAGDVRTLDTATFAAAVADPDWLQNSKPARVNTFEMKPYAVAFVSEAAG